MLHRWPDSLIKVCGVQTVEHALAAAQAGAHAIGLIFAPSRRQIDADRARQIVAALRTAHSTAIVGVFVNAAPEMMCALADGVGLDIIQLSGDETPALLEHLNRPVLKAIRLVNDANEQDWRRCALEQGQRLRLLIDAAVAGSYGGAGVQADWVHAAQMARTLPMVLAGGLAPHNVATAIATVQPWGVDVSSGVEHNGIKDCGLITQFVEQARAAFEAQTRAFKEEQ